MEWGLELFIGGKSGILPLRGVIDRNPRESTDIPITGVEYGHCGRKESGTRTRRTHGEWMLAYANVLSSVEHNKHRDLHDWNDRRAAGEHEFPEERDFSVLE